MWNTPKDPVEFSEISQPKTGVITNKETLENKSLCLLVDFWTIL